jgi:ketosteroid isomerase-like protein
VSQENVDTAKRGIDAFNRRDVDVLAELTTADFEWFPALPGALEANGYRGREGIDTYFADVGRTWEELRIAVDDVQDLGDRAVILGRTQGRGRASGVAVEAPIGIAFDFRSGRVSRVRAYLDHAEALKAMGLAE